MKEDLAKATLWQTRRLIGRERSPRIVLEAMRRRALLGDQAQRINIGNVNSNKVQGSVRHTWLI